MTKYQPMHQWLIGSRETSVVATFAELENILGFQLPLSARAHRQWWGNERVHHRHTYCRAWLDAGFKTENVNVAEETLIFRKTRNT